MFELIMYLIKPTSVTFPFTIFVPDFSVSTKAEEFKTTHSVRTPLLTFC